MVLTMARRPPKSTLALTLALCMLGWLGVGDAASAGPSARRATSALLGGVNIGGVAARSTPGEADRAIAAARALHAKLVRLAVPWSLLEPAGPNEVEPRALAYTDRVVADAAADGIGVILMVESTPCWVSSAPPSLLSKCQPGKETQASSWPPSEPAAFASFCAYLAERYGTRLTALEIWNEPDQSNEAYFAGPHKATRYAALLRAAYPAIKRVNPSVAVIAGSIVGSNGLFLRALYAAGIKGYYDGLAVHFYTLTLAALRSIHEVQLANGDSTPLWLDEFGWSSCWPHHKIQQEQGCVTARTQAANIASALREMAGAPWIAAAVLYKLRDSSGEDFGMLSASGSRKPSFSALARVLASPFGSYSPVTLGLRRLRGGGILASGSGPVGDFMQLEAFKGSVLRYRALFTLNRFNRYSLVLPSVLGANGLRVRVFQYWAGLGRAASKGI
jgi:polysaccharide biosynthesis protein PslG